MDISSLDIFICVALTAFSIIYTIILTRKAETNLIGYLLFSRKLTLPLFVTTLVSTWYGDIFGVTQIAFKNGIYGIFVFGIPFYISSIVFMLFFVEKARKTLAVSIPDIFAKLYGVKAAKLSAIMIIIESLPVTYAIGIGVLLKNLTGWSLSYSVIIGVAIVVIYIGVRGFSGIIYSDAIQFVLMFSSAIAVLIVSVVKFGGFSFLAAKLEPSYFSFQGDHDISTVLIWFFLAFIATVMSPVFYQRCFAANSTKTAKNGILIAVIFWMIFDVCTVLGGMYAKAVYSSADPSEAYFLYCISVLPQGLKGLFLAGIIATILSSLDSFLFINSSTILFDLLGNKYSKKNKAKIISLLISSTLTVVLALKFSDSIETYLLIFSSYTAIPFAVPLLFSILFRKILSEKQILICVLSTIFVMAINDIYFNIFKSFYLGATYSIVIFSILLMYNKYIICDARNR
ncbi:MAG: SSS family solute:Na+ symporter [Candidatus Midichloriaceae bacterium]|jgi:SSS family solute:Na+ symporter